MDDLSWMGQLGPRDIQSLDVSVNRITDTQLRHLSNLADLKSLELSHTQVTDRLCLIGVAFLVTGNTRFQLPAIVGYAFGFPFVCLLLVILFSRSELRSQSGQ